jgi:hypothetical protein
MKQQSDLWTRVVLSEALNGDFYEGMTIGRMGL